jgi:hypothetical protein
MRCGGSPDQHVSQRGKQQPLLIRPPILTESSAAEHVQLIFLELIFHAAASTVEVVVQRLCLSFKVGPDTTRIDTVF